MDFSRLLKVELHLHLDCSLSYKVVQQLDPSISPEQYQKNFVGPRKCDDLADFITRAANAIALMQTKEQLRLVTLDLFEQLKADRVIYAEIRFAPLIHTDKGLSGREVVQIVEETANEAIANTGVEAGIILCTLRHFKEAQSMETVKLVEAFQGSRVVGFDIAADEAGFPIDEHIKAFEYAKKAGLSVTAHAGEAKGAESVWETLEHFQPSRIGHGVRSVEDAKLLEYLRDHDIHLEVCLTSNVQTNVVDEIQDHPVNEIYDAGVSMSINTDARAICNVDLAKEYEILEQFFDWKKAHYLRCNLEAIKHAFLPEEKKEQLRHKLLAGYQ
jgi:adenosine deaminase